MKNNCNTVVFSKRAYNAVIQESFKKDPVETGGIMLGHIVDDTWIVMEVLPPGQNSIFQVAYFEYDEAFVNYLADSVANQYEYPLDLLGLWHRHPGSMDVFSRTDDVTNNTFAMQNPKGVISGLVNIDPRFRFTMYHLDQPKEQTKFKPNYKKVEVVVGDDVIPPYFFNLRFVNFDDSDLHPKLANSKVPLEEYVEKPNDSHYDNTVEEEYGLSDASQSEGLSQTETINDVNKNYLQHFISLNIIKEGLVSKVKANIVPKNKREIMFFCFGAAFGLLTGVMMLVVNKGMKFIPFK